MQVGCKKSFEFLWIHAKSLWRFCWFTQKAVVPRINSVWHSIPAQLSRENKKFSPGIVQKGSRLNDYELALQWLLDCGLLYKVKQVSKPSIPLYAIGTDFLD